MPQMKILVDVTCSKKGRCCVRPRSKKWARSFARMRRQGGGPSGGDACISETRLNNDIRLPPADRVALRRGYDTAVEVDSHIVGSWYGHGAIAVAQRPMTLLQSPPRFSRTGRKRTLGRVDSYGPNRSAIFYVGQKRGMETPNKTGRCSRLEKNITVTTMDRGVLAERIKQVGKADTGATRTSGKGWYQGSPEPSATYEIVFIPNTRETNYRKFRQNMNKLAESMGKRFCQDSVIIVHNNGDKRTTCGATWFIKGPTKC